MGLACLGGRKIGVRLRHGTIVDEVDGLCVIGAAGDTLQKASLVVNYNYQLEPAVRPHYVAVVPCLVLSCLINLITWILNFKQEIISNQHSRWCHRCEGSLKNVANADFRTRDIQPVQRGRSSLSTRSGASDTNQHKDSLLTGDESMHWLP